MRTVLIILMLIATTLALAQQEITRLQCSGKYSNFLTGYKDIGDNGGYVEFRKTASR